VVESIVKEAHLEIPSSQIPVYAPNPCLDDSAVQLNIFIILLLRSTTIPTNELKHTVKKLRLSGMLETLNDRVAYAKKTQLH